MTPSFRIAALGAALLLIGSRTAQAQTDHLHIGAHLGYNFDVKDPNLGVQFSYPIAHHLEIYPSVDYYFVSGIKEWGFNADLKWRVARDQPRWFYVGAGLNIMRVSFAGVSSTTEHANLIMGAESLRGQVHPFAELRAILGRGSSVQVQAGLNITLGRH